MAKKLVFIGGHHTSSLEVAKQLKSEGWEIVWFGHLHSMWGDQSDSAEYTDVTAMGIKFYDLLAGKFYHTYNPLKLLRIPWGFIQAFVWLVREKPRGIVSFGGYLAVPTVICGWVLGIKSITHEQTVITGWANKILGWFATKVAVTWPASLAHYPKSKTVLTGLPIAEEIKRLRNKDTKGNVLLIVGGKQGSHIINEIVFQALPRLVKTFEVWHQTGTSTLYNDQEQALQFKFANYHPFGYSRKEYLLCLDKATLVVSRAGAHVVYELGLLGKRCVLIPIPWVSHQEQVKNAQVLEAAGLAVILPEDNLTAQSLQSALVNASKLQPKTLDLPQDGLDKVVQLIKETFNA